MTLRGWMLVSLAMTLLVMVATLTYAFWDVPPIAREVPLIDPGAKVIGLISDTHLHFPPRTPAESPLRFFEVFREANVSLIVHAGDLVSLDVIEELEKIAPVVAVHGNMDPPEVRAVLPAMAVVEVNGWRIGVMHSTGLPPFWGMSEMERIAHENDLDVLVTGHTHRPFLRVAKGMIFINPGSPADPLPPFLMKRTVGILVVREEAIEPYIVEV